MTLFQALASTPQTLDTPKNWHHYTTIENVAIKLKSYELSIDLEFCNFNVSCEHIEGSTKFLFLPIIWKVDAVSLPFAALEILVSVCRVEISEKFPFVQFEIELKFQILRETRCAIRLIFYSNDHFRVRREGAL